MEIKEAFSLVSFDPANFLVSKIVSNKYQVFLYRLAQLFVHNLCKIISNKFKVVDSFRIFFSKTGPEGLLDIKKSNSKRLFSNNSQRKTVECHRFRLRLRHAVILISNIRASVSKKTNGMALIGTVKVSTTAFERTSGKCHSFKEIEYI